MGIARVASRCVRIEFGPIAESVLAGRLVAEGATADAASVAAAAAGGNLDRARLLAADDEFVARRDQSYWRDLRSRLPVWDEMIREFNREAGVLTATA